MENLTNNHVLLPVAVAVISATILFTLRRLGFAYLNRWASKTETMLDDIIMDSISTPSFFWCIALGLYFGFDASHLEVKYVQNINKIIHVLLIFSVTSTLANMASGIFKVYIKESKIPIPSTGLVYILIKALIYIAGILVILSFLGVSIAPLITALGVGGLAFALALQDTLSNLFAGLHIIIERLLRVGDYVKLENGNEGHIADISWRTTRIKMLTNNIIVIPNNKLSQSVVINFSLPEQSLSVSLPVFVSIYSDPEKVDNVLLDVMKNSLVNIKGVLKTPEPVLRFSPGVSENSIGYTISFNVEDYSSQFFALHELRKGIFKAFKENNIELPMPMRAVVLKKE